MAESIVALIAGSIVIWSLIARYSTINTPEFYKNTKITMFLFSAMAIGISMLNPQKIADIMDLPGDGELLLIFLFGLFPVIFKVLKDYPLVYSFEFNKWMIILPLIAGAVTALLHDINIQLSYISYFICFIIILGFIHSLLGSVIAGINIALIISHFFTNGVLGFDLGSVFDVFEQVGISSTPLKWLIVISSTTLGLHGYITLENLKDIIKDVIN